MVQLKHTCLKFISLNFTDLITDAKFLLIVEKDATFQRLLDDNFCNKMSPCIMVTVYYLLLPQLPDECTTLLISKRGLWLPRWLSGKESTCQCWRHGFYPWVRKIPWSRKWQTVPVFLPEKSQGQRSPGGYSPRNCKESDTTEARKHRRVVHNFIYEFEQHSLVTMKHPLGL